MQESLVAALKAALQLVPYGIGSSMAEAFFGTIDARRLKRAEQFLDSFAQDIRRLGTRVSDLETMDFTTDEFAQLFEEILRRVLLESRRQKLAALRGALVTIVVEPHKVTFDKKSSFLKSLDAFEDVHIHVLRLLASLADLPLQERFLAMTQLASRLDVSEEADVNFLYSAMDTLANREFVQTGPIPFQRDQTIDKAQQTFRITALGLRFLAFIRFNADDRPTAHE
jgi:hypothetical protein